MKALTEVQEQTLEVIKQLIVARRYSPTVREIAKQRGVRRPSTVHKTLYELKRKGAITFVPRQPRTIVVLAD